MNEETEQPPTDDRPRGILSDADREFLRGERELTDSAAHNARQRIRERIRAGLTDFELLWRHLSDRDLELVFNREDDSDSRQLRSSAHHMIAFIRLGLWTNRDPHPDRIADAIEQAAFAAGRLANAEVELDTEPIPEGDLLLAMIRDKNNHIAELRNQIEEGDYGSASEQQLRVEAKREATFLYQLVEQALRDPSVDAESLAEMELFGVETELTPEIIETEQAGWAEMEVVRPSLPVLTEFTTHNPDSANDHTDKSLE